MTNLSVLYKEIDGYKIITGFGQLVVDTEASKKCATNAIAVIVDGGCKKLPELKKQVEKIQEQSFLTQKAMEAKQKAKIVIHATAEAAKKKDLKAVSLFNNEKEKLEQEYQDFHGAARLVNNELKQIKLELEPKIREIREQNVAYCEPRANEMIDRETADLCMSKPTEDMGDVILPNGVTVAQLMQLDMGKGPHELIDISGNVVVDYRGEWYSKVDDKWILNNIVEIGVNPFVNDISKSDLTPEQLEEIRLQNLTPEQKTAEKEQAIESAAMQAANMRSKLDIQGDQDALTKAQDWYNGKVAEIEAKYV
ncbi:MAG: hypothetical protein P8X74_03675 [Reinekea sp.]